MWEGLHLLFCQDSVHIPGADFLCTCNTVVDPGFHIKAARVLLWSETV